MDKKQEKSEANALRLEYKRSDEALRKFLAKYGLRRDMDVDEIYLASSGLTSAICSLGDRFLNLKLLWLQSNKIKRLPFIQTCKCLTEIYLQSNFIQTIDHCFRKLTTLEVIHLQANQLSDLQATAKELSYLKFLRDLNLFDNPLELEKDYRQLILYTIPSLQKLDRNTLTNGEKVISTRVYQPERVKIDKTHAFLRCISRDELEVNDQNQQSLPQLNSWSNTNNNLYPTNSRNKNRSLSLWSNNNNNNNENNDISNNRHLQSTMLMSSLNNTRNNTSNNNNNPKVKTFDMDNFLRASQSIKEFSFFDWSKVKLKNGEEGKLEEEIVKNEKNNNEVNKKITNSNNSNTNTNSNFTTSTKLKKLKELPQVITIRFT